MKIEKSTPMWVTLAMGNIPTRKMAIWLVISNVIFTLYCLPWVNYSKSPLVKMLFRIDDWSWVAFMLPMTIWYAIALRWADVNNAWEEVV